jgi:acid phosphatase family membrane protein YuiD
VAVALCFIVVIDANSLRQHVGKQAAAINRLADGDQKHRWLRERMGHTVVEICGGLATGIAIGHLVFHLFGRA